MLAISGIATACSLVTVESLPEIHQEKFKKFAMKLYKYDYVFNSQSINKYSTFALSIFTYAKVINDNGF